MSADQDELKRAAAVAAVAELQSGMRIGLGTGTTMSFALDEVARRVHQEGLRIAGIPTSSRTEARARELGIPLTGFVETESLDIAIDGADELLPDTLTLIKGRGGALLRERIVAAAARRFLIAIDQSKVALRFATRAPVPVEVVPFGHEATARRLSRLGLRPVLRVDSEKKPVTTDSGNLLYDCHDVEAGTDPATLADDLRRTVGVVDSGIFVGLATEAFVAEAPAVVRRIRPQNSKVNA
ncbi:MAG TPA: ribose 5-phosphate isomerase A [Stellaceae bacterium]|nr:ribose 5-phosphate isomerase A [Stellaceae bacterium]